MHSSEKLRKTLESIEMLSLQQKTKEKAISCQNRTITQENFFHEIY